MVIEAMLEVFLGGGGGAFLAGGGGAGLEDWLLEGGGGGGAFFFAGGGGGALELSVEGLLGGGGGAFPTFFGFCGGGDSLAFTMSCEISFPSIDLLTLLGTSLEDGLEWTVGELFFLVGGLGFTAGDDFGIGIFLGRGLLLGSGAG